MGKGTGTFLLTPKVGGGTKVFYTREDDETIVKMLNDGSTIKEISEVIGHSKASVTYRSSRVLAFMNSFDEYDYSSNKLNLTADQKAERTAEREVAAKVSKQDSSK